MRHFAGRETSSLGVSVDWSLSLFLQADNLTQVVSGDSWFAEVFAWATKLVF